jgi:hypothetical protein
LRGFNDSRAKYCVLVDDDNVIGPDFLQRALAVMDAEPGLGAVGGPVQPEFEVPVPVWTREFEGLLAVRDFGDAARRADWRDSDSRRYPEFAPIGAGMIVRRSAVQAYLGALQRDPRRRAFDRTGLQLVSGGDNDMVMTILEAGFAVGYEPNLRLTHLIPARRLARRHLGALNRAIARSWVRVLALHGIEPWPPVRRSSIWLRQQRAAWRTRPWRGPAEWVRWQGLCGVFEGQADLWELQNEARKSAAPEGASAPLQS